MPLYTYRCPGCGMTKDCFQHVSDLDVTTLGCWDCDLTMVRVIYAPLLVKATPTVCYDSPIDGRPITSMQAREEDLKRSGCTPYDPAQKQDYDRRIKESEAELDASIEAHVEEAVTKMDGESRRRLASELLDQGVSAEAVRTTRHG